MWVDQCPGSFSAHVLQPQATVRDAYTMATYTVKDGRIALTPDGEGIVLLEELTQ